MELSLELSKPEYQTGTYAERLALLHSKTESVIGKIAYGNTLHLVSMLARGLRARIESCAVPELKNAWAEALQPAYLASPAYSINVALPEIRGMLDAGLSAGVCTSEEYAFIIHLATYQRQMWPDTTLRDVVAHFNPALTDVGEWTELQYQGGRLALTLQQALPEPSLVRIEASESVDGESWTAWQRVSHFYNVCDAGLHLAEIPRSQLQRKIRWRGEYYKVVGTVAGV